MRAGLLCCCGLLAACSFDGGGIAGDDEPGAPDAGPDASGCGGEALSFQPANVERCAIPAPRGDFTFPDEIVTVDTAAGTIRRASGGLVDDLASAIVTQPGSELEAMVIAANDLTLGAGTELRVTGTRPLILVAVGTMTIDGSVLATAALDQPGPGADLACTTGAGAPGVTQTVENGLDGGAGGGGGGLGTPGGTGAYVSPVVAEPVAVAGGAAWGGDELVPLVGGCSGGGGATPAGTRTRGGGGGGALGLVAERILVGGTAVISASGGGGRGAEPETGGGGGGGSGGAIRFEGPEATIAGAVIANGGGGGEGRRNTQAGMPGADGSSARVTAMTPAPGGMGAAGGNGGSGGVLLAGGGNAEAGIGATENTAGGGGGGGGVGRIRIEVASLDLAGGVFSPPPD